MKKTYPPLIISLIFLFLVFSGSAFAQQFKAADWTGEYLFEVAESRTAAGSLPTIEYRLIVTHKGDLSSGRLVADGYQTDDRYLCTIKSGDDKIELYYLKDDTIPGEPARHSYKRGELLGSLTKVVTNGKTKYLYTASSYEIYPAAFAAKHPIYFKRTK